MLSPWSWSSRQNNSKSLNLIMVISLNVLISCFANSVPDGHHLVQGDIMMPLGQLPEDVMNEPRGEGDTRKLMQNKDRLWPDGADGWPEVPYTILQSASAYSGSILNGLSQWEKHSCIRFTNVSSTYEGPHIRFYKGKGCWSEMGRQQKSKGQLVSIGKGCQHVGIVMHEVGHAIGFSHEHCRSDRGDSIKVLLANVGKRAKKNFNMVNTRNKVPYDYSSIMQYGIYQDSKTGKATMVTRNPYDIRHIWKKRLELSFRDVKEANLGYKCIDKWMAEFPDHPDCQNEGYIGSEGVCICPQGTDGEFCEKKVGDYFPELTCGGNITESTTIMPITPPNPKKPTRCMWWIQAPVCHKVRLTVVEFKIKKPCNKYSHFFELRTDDPILPGKMYCDNSLVPNQEILSEKQDMFINFNGKLKGSNFNFNIDFVEDTACDTDNKVVDPEGNKSLIGPSGNKIIGPKV